MNLVLLNKEDFVGKNRAAISGRRAEHIISVHRAKPGKTLKAGMLDGNMGSATVLELKKGKITLETNLNETPPKPLPLILICALPRPKSLKKVIQAATSMGVKDFYFIETWKVDKSYWKSPVLEKEKLFEQMVLGLEQGRDTVLPRIELRRKFKPFAEDEISDIIKGALPLLAHPGSEKQFPHQMNQKTVLAIGPEGGFTDYETKLLTKKGFEPVNIGERILRVECAVAACIGKLF